MQFLFHVLKIASQVSRCNPALQRVRLDALFIACVQIACCQKGVRWTLRSFHPFIRVAAVGIQGHSCKTLRWHSPLNTFFSCGEPHARQFFKDAPFPLKHCSINQLHFLIEKDP